MEEEEEEDDEEEDDEVAVKAMTSFPASLLVEIERVPSPSPGLPLCFARYSTTFGAETDIILCPIYNDWKGERKGRGGWSPGAGEVPERVVPFCFGGGKRGVSKREV